MPIGRSRRQGIVMGAALASSRAKKREAGLQQQSAASAPKSSQAMPQANLDNDMFAQLEKLAELKEKGILSQGEFDAKKKQILNI